MKFVIATGNAHKVEEFSRILTPLGIEVVSQQTLGIDIEVEETGSTFAQNAFLKADAICKASGLPTVADDSGLMVDALDGAPGVYTARYAGEHATNEQNIEKLLQALAGVAHEKRTARFVSAICCCCPDGGTITAEGTCEGHIGLATQGKEGFGYDPVFLQEQAGCFGLASPAQKDAVSHRGRALRILAQKLAEHLRLD